MAVSSRAEVVAAFDAFGDAVSGLADLSFDALTTPERLALLERLEHDMRRLPVARHALVTYTTGLGTRTLLTLPRDHQTGRRPRGCP